MSSLDISPRDLIAKRYDVDFLKTTLTSESRVAFEALKTAIPSIPTSLAPYAALDAFDAVLHSARKLPDDPFFARVIEPHVTSKERQEVFEQITIRAVSAIDNQQWNLGRFDFARFIRARLDDIKPQNLSPEGGAAINACIATVNELLGTQEIAPLPGFPVSPHRPVQQRLWDIQLAQS